LKTTFYFSSLILTFVLLNGCGKSEVDIEKDNLQKQSNELKIKIDSSQVRIDSAKKELDSLMYKFKQDSAEVDSLMKKINPLKKIK
jgi:peptidoglycan hydrolase CwlO-like protein